MEEVSISGLELQRWFLEFDLSGVGFVLFLLESSFRVMTFQDIQYISQL